MEDYKDILKSYWYFFLIVIALALISPIVFVFYGQAIMATLYKSNGLVVGAFFYVLLRVFYIFLIMNLGRYFTGFAISAMCPKISEKIKKISFNKVFSNDVVFFFKRNEKNVENAIQLFSENLVEIINIFSLKMMNPVIEVFMTIFFVFLFNKIVSGLMLMWLLIIVLIAYFFIKKQIKLLNHLVKVRQYQSDIIFEYHKNILVSKIYNFHGESAHKYNICLEEERKTSSKLIKTQWFQVLLIATVNITFICGGAYFSLGMEDKIYIKHINFMMSMVFNFFSALLDSVQIVQRMGYCMKHEDLLEREEKIARNTLKCPENPVIIFKDVSKTIGEDTFLKSVNLVIKENENVLIEGKSGSGKTTLFLLLLGMMENTTGSITVNHTHNILDIDNNEWVSRFSYVPQNAILYNDTIRHNIVKGLETYSEEDFIKVCKICLVDDFVQEMDKGYDQLVGVSGNNLSGGQRQRVVLARALMRDYNIVNGMKLTRKRTLCLDEAWASLSREEALMIAKNLSQEVGQRGFIVIDHTGIWKEICGKNIDSIYTIENGVVAQ